MGVALLEYHSKCATVTEKQKQGVLLLIRATQALYDTVGAHGYQRREGKIATFPF